ncbi:APC family permease [Ureaplasma ceti]|uniref:Amino acid permease n=1 Tax=Ureaplasma ceti TaxID=3119530 RepID=A0ABP9U771_9BACT
MKKLNALQKSKKENVESFANADTKKKIGFFSAMLVAVGSSIGSGIFFKAGSVLSDSHGSIVFAMFCWIFAAFAVMCMGIALIEIASARNDNLSVIGWCKTFNSRWIYKACKNFMFYVYLPLDYFVMPFYIVMSFQDGIASINMNDGHAYDGLGTHADWAIIMVIAICIALYFILVCGFSSKAGNIQNWIIMSVKFLPLAFAAITGFVIIGELGHVAGNYAAGFIAPPLAEGSQNSDAVWSFGSMTPGFGLFLAAAGIFFAYDGFYVAAGVQSEMKEPKKAPMAIILGLSVITVIYLILAISMSLGSKNGGPQGLLFFFADHKCVQVYATFKIILGISVLSIINGYAMWKPRFTEDLIRDGELPLSAKYVAKLNPHKPVVGITYDIIITLPVILIFSIIGGLGYIDAGGYANQSFVSFAQLAVADPKLAEALLQSGIQHPDVPLLNVTENLSNAADRKLVYSTWLNQLQHGTTIQALTIEGQAINPSDATFIYNYGTGMAKLYSFCDLMANWTSLFTFAFITVAIYGGLKNRKTQHVKVAPNKYFKTFAILSIILMVAPLFFNVFEPIANLFFLFRLEHLDTTNHVELVSRILTVVVLLLYFAFTFLPTTFENVYATHKYGSVAAYEEQKFQKIATQLKISNQINENNETEKLISLTND